MKAPEACCLTISTEFPVKPATEACRVRIAVGGIASAKRGSKVKFTSEMETAYARGLEMSRQHAHQSTHEDLQPPDHLVSEYTSENEQAAFCAGWMDGTGVLDVLSVREAMESD